MRLALLVMFVGCASPGDPHRIVACSSSWNVSPAPPNCELACETQEGHPIYQSCIIDNWQGAPPGTDCSNGFHDGSPRTFDGRLGCCMIGLDGDPTTRRWYTCH